MEMWSFYNNSIFYIIFYMLSPVAISSLTENYSFKPDHYGYSQERLKQRSTSFYLTSIIGLDGISFTTGNSSDTGPMTVRPFQEPPLLSPNVTSDRMTYIGGDHIRANCTSPPSLPAANITWYVNEQMVPSFTANHVLNFSNGYASSLSTLELEAAVLSPVPTLMIRCEASIFDVWKATSHTIVLRERNTNPASALGRSFTGAATKSCLPTMIVLLIYFFVQFLLDSYTETSIR